MATKKTTKKVVAVETLKNTSPEYSLNFVDMFKVLRGALVTLGGTMITYFANSYTSISYSFDFKGSHYDLTPIAVVVFSALIEVARRFLSNYSSK